MIEVFLKVISILLLTMVKFIAGPTLGYAAEFSFLGTVAITIGGMMASVLLFTFLGEFLRKRVLVYLFRKRKRFTRRNRKFVRIWKQYGLIGVALLTPLILTPIGGTLLLTSFNSPRKQIIIWMFISAVIWSFFFTGLVYTIGDQIFTYIG